jgi:hypothetical protein
MALGRVPLLRGLDPERAVPGAHAAGSILWTLRALGAPRLMLHSALLSFIEPGGSRRAEFESGAGF